MPIYVNADDPIQVDACWKVQALFKAGLIDAQQAAQIVAQSRSDEAITEENRQAAWDKTHDW